MKLKPQLLAACIAGAFVVSAQAQVAGSGLYVGGNVGQAKLKGDDFPGLDNSNTGGKLYGGYDFTPNIGMELGYVDLGSFDYGNGTVKANGVFLDGVGKVMFAPGWWGLARLGAFQGKLDNGPSDDNGTSYKAGIGVQYDLTANAGVRAEFERYKFDALGVKPKADLFSVGFNYRF